MIKRILFIVSIIFLTACSTGKTSSKTKVYKRYPESLSIDSLSQTNDSIAKSNIPLKDSCATLILNNGARVFIKNQEFFQDTIKFKSCDTTVIFPQVVANKEVNLVTQNQDTLFYNSSSQSELITEEQHFSEEEEMDIEYEEIINADKKAELTVKIANQYGIKKNQIIAIGDGANDINMFKESGLSISMHGKPVLDDLVTWSVKKNYFKTILDLFIFLEKE